MSATTEIRPVTVSPQDVEARIGQVEARIGQYDWPALHQDLDMQGCAVPKNLLTPAECTEIAELYAEQALFRSRIVMARHGFGKGEYQYFSYPLPELIAGLRTFLYPRLALLANAWNERMRVDRRYPAEHAAFLAECHEQGQTRPTPLLLQYVQGDFDPAVRAGARFHRRRIRADRAATSHAEPGRGRAASAG
jgi:hypothetical protein